jgi:hypothetical protein
MLIVHHSEMLFRQYPLLISITLGDGLTLHFDGGQRELQGYSSMITAYPFKNCIAISYALVERWGAHEDVVHAGDSLGIEVGRSAGVGDTSIWVMLEECILDVHLICA